MGKVINMKEWIENHRYEKLEDHFDWNVDPDTEAMIEYVDDISMNVYETLINILKDEGVIPSVVPYLEKDNEK